MPTPRPVLIYDADCPVCRGSVEWVRRGASDPRAFEFLPCRSPETRVRFPSVGEADCLRAAHLVLPDGTVLAGEKAIPEILRRLPRWRLLAPLFSLPGAAFLSRVLYRLFAAHRYRFAGGEHSSPPPGR
jgi:predicted DCC family thiol-disulfide oxidoreductase YuxK